MAGTGVESVAATTGLGTALDEGGAVEISSADVAAATGDPTTEPRYGQQWDMDMIHLPQAHAVTTGSPNVVVGVLDLAARADVAVLGSLPHGVPEFAIPWITVDDTVPVLLGGCAGRIDIEISVLTSFQDIKGPEEIEVGKHGLFVCKGSQSGLLLPQVATEHNWDRIEFLQWTCQKAGLHKDAWKEHGTRIQVFSADVF